MWTMRYNIWRGPLVDQSVDVWTVSHICWYLSSTNTGLPSSSFLPSAFPLPPDRYSWRALSLAVLAVPLIHCHYLDATPRYRCPTSWPIGTRDARMDEPSRRQRALCVCILATLALCDPSRVVDFRYPSRRYGTRDARTDESSRPQ